MGCRCLGSDRRRGGHANIDVPDIAMPPRLSAAAADAACDSFGTAGEKPLKRRITCYLERSDPAVGIVFGYDFIAVTHNDGRAHQHAFV